MHVCAACPSLGCTSTTGCDHAHAILHAALACRVFCGRHHTRLLLLASTIAKVSSVDTRENSQPFRARAGRHVPARTPVTPFCSADLSGAETTHPEALLSHAVTSHAHACVIPQTPSSRGALHGPPYL